VLVTVNGFFAAVEFSLVAVRLSRVRQLMEAGDPRARIVLDLLGHLVRADSSRVRAPAGSESAILRRMHECVALPADSPNPLRIHRLVPSSRSIAGRNMPRYHWKGRATSKATGRHACRLRLFGTNSQYNVQNRQQKNATASEIACTTNAVCRPENCNQLASAAAA